MTAEDGRTDDWSPDTTAIGVFIITIHFAEDLSAQDSNGKSDPYVVLAYAKVCRGTSPGREVSLTVVSSLVNPCIRRESFSAT